MAADTRVQKSLDMAARFVEPAILRDHAAPGASATKVIAQSRYGHDDLSHQRTAILQACQLLKDVANAIAVERKNSVEDRSPEIGVMAVVFRLLDLILLEGMYPSLSSGVGFPEQRKRRSTLCNRNLEKFNNLDTLSVVLTDLNALTFDSDSGLFQQMQNTILLDLIAADAQMAYYPKRSELDRQVASDLFSQQLKQVSTSRLHQILTNLIRAPAPIWLRVGLSHHLSMLPLRPRGVEHTIEFLESFFGIRLPSDVESQSQTVKGRPLHPEALAQATKVLTSVPSSMTMNEYYDRIAPQFVNLLDGASGEELAQAAGSIIANGILSKRDVGAPNSVGWRWFVAPQIAAINPHGDDVRKALEGNHATRELVFIVDQSLLETALRRLVTILQSTINVSVTGRLLRPILLCLWAIATYDASALADLTYSKVAQELCETFLQRCGSVEHLILLYDNISFDGEETWTYGPGDATGIAIRVREQLTQNVDGMEKMARTSGRIEKLVELLAASRISEKILGDFFIYALRHLRSSEIISTYRATALLTPEQDPMQRLSAIQLASTLLTRFGPNLAAEPVPILQFVDQLLLDAIADSNSGREKQKLDHLSLANIVSDTSTPAVGLVTDVFDDMIATTMSLLKSLLNTGNLVNEGDFEPILHDLAIHAQLLLSARSSLSTTTKAALSSAVQLLKSILIDGPSLNIAANGVTVVTPADIFSNNDAATQARFLSEWILTTGDTTKYIDAPATTFTLLQQLRLGPDAYVVTYINEALAKLAANRAPGYVVRTIVSAFRDADEQTNLDGRLHLAEALVCIIEALTANVDAQPADLAELMLSVVNACLAVISRRTARSLEHVRRRQAEKEARKEQIQAERDFGGPMPDLDSLDLSDEENLETGVRERQRQDYSAIQKIVRGWEGLDKTEDIRVQTSAMSILSTVLERTARALAASTVSDAVDISLTVLLLEHGEEAIIPRRAAVLVAMAHLQAVDAALDDGATVASLDAAKWLEVQDRLTSVAQMDEDGLVRENASTVLESLQTLRLKQMMHSTNLSSTRDGLSLNELQGLEVILTKPEKPKIQVLE